jgi:hypothetical protein
MWAVCYSILSVPRNDKKLTIVELVRLLIYQRALLDLFVLKVPKNSPGHKTMVVHDPFGTLFWSHQESHIELNMSQTKSMIT